MYKRLFIIFAVSLSFVTVGVFAQDAPKAKNVIIFIGDGMGFNSDLAGTYYRYGEAGKQSYHAFPVRVGCTTYSLEADAHDDHVGYDPAVFWKPFTAGERVEFTDSAAASTAIHSGSKTLDLRVGIDAHDNPLELISEVAVRTGRKAGCVTSDLISRATPAGFCAHSPSRYDLDGIFNQMIDEKSPISVVMGGGEWFDAEGKKWVFDPNNPENDKAKRSFGVSSKATWEKTRSGRVNGFTVISTRKQFEELASPKQGTSLPSKVIGLIHCKVTVPPVDGPLDDVAATRELFDAEYAGAVLDDLPSLTTMTLGAINVLMQNNNKGFVLMVEGGAIDHANHGHNAARSVLEHTGFSKAVDAVIQWVETNSSWQETLVIVTGDHETGRLWGPDTFRDRNGNSVFDRSDVFNDFKPLVSTGRGDVPRVQYGDREHSNAFVPLYAKGPGAELFLKRVKGTDTKAAAMWNFSGQYVDNTDIFHVMKAVIAP